MNHHDQHATSRTAEAAGARIQAYTVEGDDGRAPLDSVEGRGYWRDLPADKPVEFTCHPTRYRVHPEDVGLSDDPVTVWQVNDMEWLVGAGTPESILAWYMAEHGVSHEDATGHEDELPRALDGEELDRLKFVDCDEDERPTGVVRTFREQLAIEIAEGGTFPRLFATTEC